jgi:hypothetical protein
MYTGSKDTISLLRAAQANKGCVFTGGEQQHFVPPLMR